MNRSKTTLLTVLILVSASTGVAQSTDPIEELKACARMTDQDARYACFDTLGQRVLREESAGVQSTPEEVAGPEVVSTTKETNAQPMPDDLGVTKFEDKESEGIKYSGMVRSCKKGNYGDLYFFLDNGQVWKDVGERSPWIKDCKFKVTITQDFIGYKMRIDALDKTVPVKRHQ